MTTDPERADTSDVDSTEEEQEKVPIKGGGFQPASFLAALNARVNEFNYDVNK